MQLLLSVGIRFQNQHEGQKLLERKIPLEISRVTCLDNLLKLQGELGDSAPAEGRSCEGKASIVLSVFLPVQSLNFVR